MTVDGDWSHEIKIHLLGEKKKSYDKPRQYIKKQRHHFVHKVSDSQLWFFQYSCTDVTIGPYRRLSTKEFF